MTNDTDIRRIVYRRNFGKTLYAAKAIMQVALVSPNSLNWFIAPNRQQAEIVFDLLIGALRPILKKDPDYTDLRLEIDNGAVIACKVPFKAEVRHDQ